MSNYSVFEWFYNTRHHAQYRSLDRADRRKLKRIYSKWYPGSMSMMYSDCEKITSLSQIKAGDHIGWFRPGLIGHHAIVSDCCPWCGSVRVIHYKKQDGRMKVVEEWIPFWRQRGTPFKVLYDADKVIDSELAVIYRARARLGEERYNLVLNNCEHFATSCKTGTAKSYQVRWVIWL